MLKKILLGLGTLLMLGYIAGYLWLQRRNQASHTQLCEGIEVIIETEPEREIIIDKEHVFAELKKMGIKLTGEPMDKIDLTSLENILRANPIFHRAEVYRSPHSNKLKIRIEQKDPFFRVQTTDESYYVSYGRSIIPNNLTFHAYVLLFTGRITNQMATGELYDFVQYLAQSDYYRDYFGHGYYTPEEGLVLTPRLSSTSIYLGKSPDKWPEMLNKLRVYEKLVIAKKGWQNIEHIKLYIGSQVIIKEYTLPSTLLESAHS